MACGVLAYVGVGSARFWSWLNQRRNWFRGAYLNGELVGVCFGHEREPGHVGLQSIAVDENRWRRGIGTRLIRDFEEQVFRDGMERISLGSAADVRAESFYLKNGYHPTHIMIRVGPETREDVEGAVDIGPDEVVDDDEGRRFYFKVSEYEPEQRVTLRDAYSAKQAIYIFEKMRP